MAFGHSLPTRPWPKGLRMRSRDFRFAAKIGVLLEREVMKTVRFPTATFRCRGPRGDRSAWSCGSQPRNSQNIFPRFRDLPSQERSHTITYDQQKQVGTDVLRDLLPGLTGWKLIGGKQTSCHLASRCIPDAPFTGRLVSQNHTLGFEPLVWMGVDQRTIVLLRIFALHHQVNHFQGIGI